MPAASIQHGDQLRSVKPRQFRTLFISDLHLGARACQAEAFLDFLRHYDADTIYLVGDIIDFWSVKRTRFGCNRIMMCCRSFFAKPARERRSSSFRVITTRASEAIAE